MGCRQTKPEKEEKSAPCVQLENLNDKQGNGLQKVDPRLPLDARQVFKLKQSWKGIKRNMEETGMEMFIRLFKSNAYLIKIFKDFKQLETEDEMRANESLEKHATFVMTTLDEAISNIDNYDFVKDLLTRTGCSHQRFSEFQKDNFLKIRQPFLDAVKITLGDRYTDYMENVYTLTINFILQGLMDGYMDDTAIQIKLDSGHEIDRNIHEANDTTFVKAAES